MNEDVRKIRLLMALRRSGITDAKVLGAIERVPRELFVPESFADQAYEDRALPIGLGQTISQPLVVALMTQALDVAWDSKILEIGTGSGYQAAVLARLGRRVYTIERHRPLLQEAERRFAAMRLHNMTTRVADGTKGWPEQAPFQRIIVTAGHAGTEPPPALLEQLHLDGRLVIPMGEDGRRQRVVRFRRTDQGIEREELWPVRFVPLLPDLPDGEARAI